jgi:hypothetical protein
MLFAAVIVALWLLLAGNRAPDTVPAPVKQAVARPDTAGPEAVPLTKDTARIRHTDNSRPPVCADISGKKYTRADTGKKDTARAITTVRKSDTSISGTAGAAADTAPAETPDTAQGLRRQQGAQGNCADDTLAPWVYPEPSGGLHRGTVAISFRENKPCAVYWQFEPDSAWHSWTGEPVVVKRTATIAFKAIDQCGRAMGERQEYYEITDEQTEGLCPKDMELVRIGATQFCIDRYEWPNRKGALPLSYVSQYQAQDSCFIAQKRLCSSEEWSLACSGPYSWNYPYGQEYERYACVTHDTTVRPSGSRPECRAFFGVFDMSGNLLEWSATPSKENSRFYNVMGGFWQSGPQSGCFDVRYSYFPQNRHNPVGFRCCKNTATPEK